MIKWVVEQTAKDDILNIINLSVNYDSLLIIKCDSNKDNDIFKFDTDYANIDTYDNNLVLDFWDDYETIKIDISEIDKIVYEESDKDWLIVHLHLEDGVVYMLQLMK